MSMTPRHSLMEALEIINLVKVNPTEQLNQNKEMKIVDLVLLSLFMRDNEKCNISPPPPTPA